MSRDSRSARRSWDRKQRQLCSQVETALDLALGASANPLLQGCWVVDVRPAPDQTRLRVRVQTADSVPIHDLEEALLGATPWLRSEVAAFVHRRKTPTLVIVWAGPDV